MSDAAERSQLERFRQVVGARLGLRFDDDKLPLLATVLAERRLALALDPDTYVARLAARQEELELRALAERLTVGETYFFRNANDLQAFVAAVVPDRMRVRAAEQRLRILSVGCSSGEEPYTLAMLLRDVPQLASWRVDIRGVDVNPAAIAKAISGRYTAWSLRQTPPEMRTRFFRPEHGAFTVVDDIHESVTFEERNVLEDDPIFWTPGAYDVVFCRNIIMYFAPEVTRTVIQRIASTLAPGGFLFLGHAETLRGISHEFHLLHTHNTFYYQLRTGPQGPRPEPGDARAGPFGPSGTVAPLDLPGDPSWFDVIRVSSERVEGLTERAPDRTDAQGCPQGPVRPGPVAAESAHQASVRREPVEGRTGRGSLMRTDASAANPGWARVARALDLLRHDRHAAALEALGGASPDEDPETMLLRAVLLTSSGDLKESEGLCARILEKDELNAEAHYVMALCREHAGDRVAAADHDHYALYLDPSFAMPRLHLGLLAKREGDLERGCKELSRALVLLAGEEASRILLLGGGFSRDALLDLCRAELRACGGTW